MYCTEVGVLSGQHAYLRTMLKINPKITIRQLRCKVYLRDNFAPNNKNKGISITSKIAIIPSTNLSIQTQKFIFPATIAPHRGRST